MNKARKMKRPEEILFRDLYGNVVLDVDIPVPVIFVPSVSIVILGTLP